MIGERALIAELFAPLATHPAARGLADDAAVWLPPLGRAVVLTHDIIAAGTHYLADDPPSDIAWKLLAVNLSDLAAMGATPAGVLLGVTLGAEDEAWLRGFTAGLARALDHFEVALFGGDTVRWGGAAVLGCTAVGHLEPEAALARGGARPGDELWVSGTIGDAGLGLAVARGLASAEARFLLNRYRRPQPRIALGRALVGTATACLDVSDGLLIDAERLAAASGVRIEIDLAAVPLSDAARSHGDDDVARLERASAGDDYELLFAAAPDAGIERLATAKVGLTRIGRVVAGAGLRVIGAAGDIVPDRLGWEH